MGRPDTQEAYGASRFYRSINAEHDYRRTDAVSGYVLTAGARRTLRRVASTRSGGKSTRAWTLTGPYGTGKSAFCVFLAQLLAPGSFPGHAQAGAILRRADRDLGDAVLTKGARGLWPIVITGSREPLQVAILRGFRESLQAYTHRVDQSLLRQISKALGSAASGSPISDRLIVDLLSQMIAHVCGGSGAPTGLLIVVDELGKLLEFAASHPSQSDLYILQHIAEFAARSAQQILLVGVLHQDFSRYAGRLSSLERAEWDKVRGRFEDLVFEEPAEEMLRLVAEARHAVPGPAAARLFDDLCRGAGRLDLTPPAVSKAEFQQLLSHCFPLHPLVAVLLGHIFKKLAQNERSAFSFLASSEPGGLDDFVRRHDSKGIVPYCIHDLYDYLVQAIGDGLYVQRNGKRWAEVDGILDRLPGASPTAIAVVKTIGLLGAVGDWRNVAPTAAILRFALQHTASPSDVDAALKFLKARSAISQRSFNDSFVIWQGSDIDVDERVKQARDRLDPSVRLADLAKRYLPLAPLVARRHLFEKGTLRYFTIEHVHPADLPEHLGKRPTDCDGRILLVLPGNPQDEELARRTALSSSASSAIETVIGVPASVKAFDSTLRELAALDWVTSHTPELEGDPTAKRELRARQAEVRRQLDTLVSGMLVTTNGDEACHWFYGGEDCRFQSRRDLNGLLSTICDRVFRNTPILLNELVNRRQLSSAAAKGRRNLIEAMLTHSEMGGLGIEGTPAEKSMYLSVLHQTGIHREVDGVYQFGDPSPRSDAGTRAVWQEIQGFFETCDTSPRPASDLYGALTDRPFGLREGPIPILICAALIAFDAEVALYEDGTFIPQLNVPAFERLMKAPERFTLRRWRVAGVRAAVFNQLADMLGKSKVVGAVGKRNVLDVVRPLIRFAGQLNEYTKTTSRLRPEARAVRDTLLCGREPDQLLFVDLPVALGLPAIAADEHNSEVAVGYLRELRKAVGEVQRCYDELVEELRQAIANAFGVTGTVTELRRALSHRAEPIRAIACDNTLRALIGRALDATKDDRAWIESLAALLAERSPASWRESDRGVFEVALTRTSRLFCHLEPLAFGTGTYSPDGTQAFRIGITSRDNAEAEKVVRVRAEDLDEVTRVERLLDRTIGASGIAGKSEITLTALARIVKRLLS